jgi:hypothetical protein
MTVFDCSSTNRGIFQQTLVKYYAGEPDRFTPNFLERQKQGARI